MKKITSLLLSLCILLTVCSAGFVTITASAAEKIEGSEVTWSFDYQNKTLTFDGKGDIPNYDTYEDENGKVSTVEKEIQLMVNEDQSMDESNVDDTWNSDDIQPEPSTTDKLKHLAIPVGIVGVVLAAVILVVIRRKKKKAGMDDEIL